MIPLIAYLGAAGLGGYLLLRNKTAAAPAATVFPTASSTGLVIAAPGVTASPAQTASAVNQDVADQAVVNKAFQDVTAAPAAASAGASSSSTDQSGPPPVSALQTTPTAPGPATTTSFVDPGSGLRVDPSQAPPPMSVTTPDTLSQVMAAAADPFGALFGP